MGRSSLLPLFAALLFASILWLAFAVPPGFAWLIAINSAAFLTFGYDKSIAGTSRRRIPERVLLFLSLLGGSPGALLAMRVFHHKTLKASFQRKFWLVVLAQAALILFYQAALRPLLFPAS